ncbi:CHASE3 domain-containing protein [Dyella flagellata]|uniref:histidine kinase n=1 Tax=Dyella flagellata TaxID=1867833 RepID=A0ABQ5XCI2_9GAMM|nr:CHASE3 domain-containing protein [Dyella flagellata]GLQ89330.1 histidine kinase [Dyella flagellata]
MHESEQARIRLGLVGGFVLLLCVCALVIVAAFSSMGAERQVEHSMLVRQTLAQLLGGLQEAESGQRGYLLTGDSRYLAAVDTTKTQLPVLEGQLRQLTEKSTAHQRQLDAFYPLIAAKMDDLSNTIQQRQAGHADAATWLVEANLGRNRMRRIRDLADDFDRTELDMLRERTTAAAMQRSFLTTAMILVTLLASTLGFIIVMKARRYALDMREKNRSLRAEIEQREAAEQQLRQSQKMEALGQLTGGVAHDFNNMLAVIFGNLEMLVRRLPESEVRWCRLASNALAGAQRAAELTKRLLAFSRQQPLQPKSIDVNQCVQDVPMMLRRSLGENVRIDIVQGDGLWRAYVDGPQLESAILNLAVNARDAMKGVGRLGIETANVILDRSYADAQGELTPGQYVMVAVTDSGCGMSPEVISRAFDPFFTTKDIGHGTGLGLSQVHGFAKQSQGHVKIYSEQGMGTTVKLYLPRDSSKDEEKPARPVVLTTPVSPQRKVLVVEDDADVREFVVSALEDLGYQAIAADDAESARALLMEDEQIDVMLTDVVMPGANGRQLFDDIRGIRPNMTVVFMTGYSRNAIVHNGVLDDGVRLITKPFTVDELSREMLAAIAAESVLR